MEARWRLCVKKECLYCTLWRPSWSNLIIITKVFKFINLFQSVLKIKKPHETIKLLAEFLNKEIKEADLEAIIKWCSFESMKENKMVNYEWYKEMGLFKKQGFFNI